jgi:hypothetical protein
MNRFILAAIAATASGGVVALAQAVNPAHAGLPPVAIAVATRAEVQARVQERFAALDADHDGAVTRAELDAYRAKARTTRDAERDAARATRRDAMFARLDTNHDGQISKAEFAARPAPGPMDGSRPVDGAGRMGAGSHGGMDMGGSFLGPNGDRRADAFFAMLDTNKDGRVTLAEASARPLAMFDRLDTNHDGTISPEERRAAHQAMRGQWRGRRG